MKVLVATDKPFAKVAVDGIRKEIEAAGYELALLEKYDRLCIFQKLLSGAPSFEHTQVSTDQKASEVVDDPIGGE